MGSFPQVKSNASSASRRKKSRVVSPVIHLLSAKDGRGLGLVIKKKSWFVDAVQVAWPSVSIKKIIRALVFLACLVGFIYQTCTFLAYYFQYPTVVDVQVKRPEEMELPAITFCKRSEMRQNGDEQLWENGSLYSFEDIRKISENEVTKRLDVENNEANSWRALLLSCETYSRGEKKNCRLGNISSLSVPDETGHDVNCHTLFSKMNSLEIALMQIPKRKKLLLQIALSLNSDNEHSESISSQVAVHSPYAIVNPFNDGFEVEAGGLYILQISMMEKILLEAPYDTNCRDYQKLWKERGNSGPLSHQMCMELCILNITLQKYNCTALEILYPHNKNTLCKAEMKKLNEENFTICHSSCSEACRFTTYEYEIQHRKLNDRTFQNVAKSENQKHLLNQTSVLQMYLKRPEILTFTHRPQFQSVEAFSYIGGLLGIWLGVSLIALLDVIEFLAGIGSRINQRLKAKRQHLRKRTHFVT